MENINFKLEVFEGPFELLFHLIEKNEIDLYDIPISSLTQQYIDYLNSEQFKDMENISEFLVMAATLLEIKSKMLLPKPKKEDEEIDPREELVQKLLEYKIFKQVSEIFKQKEIFTDTVIFKKPENELIEFLTGEKKHEIKTVLNDITLKKLFDIYKDVLKRRELKTDKVRSSFKSIEKDSFTVNTQIEYIIKLIKNKNKIIFTDIFLESGTKKEVVVTFLAILEMIKLNVIKIEQKNNFDEILIMMT